MKFKTKRCQFLVEWLDLPAATGVEDARWEPFQLAHLQDEGTFRIECKSRQIAWSFTVAAEGVANALLDAQESIYISINLDEAKEKIRYARQIYETLCTSPLGGLPKLKRDNQFELEFSNGARLSSLPSRPPRGRSRCNVYPDEFAHAQYDKQIYTAALPVISKGGRLRIGSSPLGASGRFWEVFSQAINSYPGYRRRKTPWWTIYAFCTDVAAAHKLAPTLTTAERVERFGNERIKAIYANMPEEDFQQEYECEFVDEVTAWITWEEIKDIEDPELECYFAHGEDRQIDNALNVIERVKQRSVKANIEEVFSAGIDVGRTRNATEIFVVGHNTLGSYPLRMAITLHNTPFDEQLQVASTVLERLNVANMYIDQNGIGRNLAESLARDFPGKAQGQDFTNASKTLWATDVKMWVQKGKTPLPIDRELAYQIHSIKRTITASKNLIFDTERNEKHHADKFWAWALALAAAKAGGGLSLYELAEMFRYR